MMKVPLMVQSILGHSNPPVDSPTEEEVIATVAKMKKIVNTQVKMMLQEDHPLAYTQVYLHQSIFVDKRDQIPWLLLHHTHCQA
jgi:hypothetical protein